METWFSQEAMSSHSYTHARTHTLTHSHARTHGRTINLVRRILFTSIIYSEPALLLLPRVMKFMEAFHLISCLLSSDRDLLSLLSLSSLSLSVSLDFTSLNIQGSFLLSLSSKKWILKGVRRLASINHLGTFLFPVFIPFNNSRRILFYSLEEFIKIRIVIDFHR